MMLKRWHNPSSHKPHGRGAAAARPQRHALRVAASRDLTANIVQTVATLALKSRLKTYTDVSTRVDCDALGLMAGRMRGVQISGAGWRSPLNLTAQSLQFTVGEAALDYPALLVQRKIVLANKPRGSASITFSAADFGNFLVHPLMRTAAARAVQGQPFLFDSLSVSMQPGATTSQQQQAYATAGPAAAAAGAARSAPQPAAASWPASGSTSTGQLAAHFTGTWAGNGQRYSMMLQPGRGSGALVLPSAAAAVQQPADAAAVAAELTRFFSTLMVDLQGAQLRYRALGFVSPQGAGLGAGLGSARAAGQQQQGQQQQQLQLLLKLELDLLVASFPPLNIQF